MKKALLALLAILALVGTGFAVQQFQSDTTHEMGIDTNSNIFLRDPNTPTVTLSMMGPSVQNSVSLSSFSTITPTSKYINVGSTGTNINMAGAGTSNLPVISTGSIAYGTEIVLISTQATATVTLASGTASGLDLGSATRVLANGKALGLYYNSVKSQWVERFYGSN